MLASARRVPMATSGWIRVRSSSIWESPVFQALYLCRVYRDVANVADGAGWGRLQRRIFENFILPVPPLNEQYAIGNMISRELDSLTNVVQAKQSIIADLKAYKQSLVCEVVTGKREVR